MRRLVRAARDLVLAACVLLVLTPALARAAVNFHDWQDGSFRSACDDAARAKRPVVLIITQPDWCPPCIKLDKLWLKNPADASVRDILEDALVMEVRGYEEAGARLLRRESVAFQGTPTVHVFAPPALKTPLGRTRLLGSIVGAPDDFPEKLAAILAVQGDPLASLRAAVDAASDDVARAKALLELADAAAGRGEPAGAETALLRVMEMKPSGANPAQAPELEALVRKAQWRRASVVTLRVRKDWKKALEQIDAYAAAAPVTAEERESFGYARAWALVHLGRRDEAVAELDAALPATADGADTFLYFCFRSESPALWALGLERAKAALALHGEKEAALWQGMGRLQRRLGMLAEAESSLARAVELSPEGDDRMSYAGQLETVRAERASAAPPSR